MKTWSGILGLILSLSLMHGSIAANEPLVLSLYKGKYSGTVLYGGVVSGSTTATFSASKKKNVGKLTLTSTLNAGGTFVPFVEQFQINRKKITSYLFQVSTTSAAGTGTVKVKKRRITYSISFSLQGGSYVLQGTITKKKKSMTISEVITGAETVPITYSLRTRGK